MNLIRTITVAAALGLPLTSAQAANVLSYNFDDLLPGYDYGYTYSEFGSGTHDNGLISPTGGNGGTGGFVATFNTTPMSGAWAGIGAGLGDGGGNGNYAALNTTSLADVTLSLDARAGGLTGSSVGVVFELKFEVPDNTLTPNDSNTDADVLLRITSPGTLMSGFQTFTSTLNTWTIAEGSFAQLQSLLGVVNNINFNVAYDANGALAAFGNDAGNSFAIDNYLITVIPEPSTMALFGLGGIALLFRRRRLS